jgi:hypothetical protein
MEGEMKKILAALAVAAALAGCDVDRVKEELLGQMKETGFLTLLNLPENTSAVRVVKVGNTGVCDDPEGVSIDGGGALIPLVDLRGGKFNKTGVYPVSLLIETDGGELLITEESALFAQFVDGEGSADMSGVDKTEGAEKDYNLIILNLPERADADAFKSLQIGDNIARCADFNAITMDGSTAYAPLVDQHGERFKQTGSFYIGLNVEADSFNKVEIDYREHYIVHFTGGTGILDLENLGDQMVLGAALKMINLPQNIDIDSFKSLDVGGIAECADFDQIFVKPAEGEAQIPLILNTGKEFNKTGTYYIAARIIIDSLNEINITTDDYVMVKFTDGYGTLDINNTYQDFGLGYLNGRLTNEENYYEPKVAADSVFELLGNYFRVLNDETIKDTSTLQTMADGIVYVYAVPSQKFVVNAGLLHYEDSGYADFRYSKDAPAYNASRVGWYHGNNRALWKFLKIGGEYRYKVRADEDFPFDHAVVNTTIGGLREEFKGDIYPVEITLEPGFYCFETAGASGGGGGVFDGIGGGSPGSGSQKASYTDFSSEYWTASSGGEGGRIIELINIKQPRKFWVYTGTKGKDGKPYGDGGLGDLDTLVIVGGGGGSGSYISDAVGSEKGYILCAGGGGGGYVKFDLTFTFTYTTKRIQGDGYLYYTLLPLRKVKAYAAGGGGGASGGGGAAGWLGSYENDNTGNILYPSQERGGLGCGGGIFGGVPYHQIDGIGLPESPGYTTILKENSGGGSTTFGDDPPATVTAPSLDYFVKESGAGAGVLGLQNISGNAGYINSSGTAYAPASGGNNRTGVRGGNSGDGYVRIYKLQ